MPGPAEPPTGADSVPVGCTSWCDPAKIRTKRYDVAVAPGRQLVEGPYVAETFAVAVEENYVVVEV